MTLTIALVSSFRNKVLISQDARYPHEHLFSEGVSTSLLASGDTTNCLTTLLELLPNLLQDPFLEILCDDTRPTFARKLILS